MGWLMEQQGCRRGSVNASFPSVPIDKDSQDLGLEEEFPGEQLLVPEGDQGRNPSRNLNTPRSVGQSRTYLGCSAAGYRHCQTTVWKVKELGGDPQELQGAFCQLIQLLLLEQQRLKDAMCHCLHPWDGAWRWKNVLWVGKLPQCLFSQQKTPAAALLPPDTVRCLLALRPLSDFIAGDIPWQCPLCPQ